MARTRRDTPWLAQESNDVYYAFWYDPEQSRTRRLSLATKDPGEASRRFGAFLLGGEEIRRPKPPEGISVARALDDYLKEHVNAKDDRGRPNVSSPERQEAAVRHLKQFFGEAPLQSVDIPACRRFAEARRSGTIGSGKGSRPNNPERQVKNTAGSDSTIRRELVVLKAATQHALRWKRITADQLPTFETPGENEREFGEEPWLKREELDALLSEAKGDLADFIRLGYWTAYRRATIETLHVDMIDFGTGIINPYRLGRRRTRKRQAIVPIFPEIREALERRAREARNGMLFGADARFYRRFVGLCGSLGIDEARDHPHVLRHSRATHMLMDGESIYKVAKLLGDTVATVEKRYGHFSPEYLMNKGQ